MGARGSRLIGAVGMTMPDLNYFERREQQERRFAARALDDAAKRAHLELAERYSALLGMAMTTSNPSRAA